MTATNSGVSGMLRYKEAAGYLGFCVDHFRKLLQGRDGLKIPHYRIGNRMFFKPTDLDLWVEKHKKYKT